MAKEDLRFHRGFFDNIKIKRFRAEFDGASCPLCCLMKIWVYAAMHKSEGKFEGDHSKEDFELMADWQGERGRFASMLIKHRLIVETPEGYAINDWDEWQPWVAKSKQRSASAKANAGARWDKKNANLKIRNAESEIRNAELKKRNAEFENRNAPTPTPIPIPKPIPKPVPTPDEIQGFEDVQDLPGAVIAWYNTEVCPPFNKCKSATKNVRWGILRAIDILREAWGPARVGGHEFSAMKEYLTQAKEQYEHGGVPCRWGISNLCKEDNITKVLDGVYSPKEEAADWAAEAKREKKG